jgi:hypothetical protein
VGQPSRVNTGGLAQAFGMYVLELLVFTNTEEATEL